MKRRALAYLIATALAVVIALLCVSMELDSGEAGMALTVSYFSDGFFLSAVMYMGCGLLTFIAEAGNFYGLQFLGYTLVRVFSPRKERFEDRKDYFTYCTEKKAKQAEKGKSSIKWVMLHVGLGCLALSAIFALVFYRMA
ncbi:MAG: hypothetical protein ACI4ML_08860 [Aristaeellaceae bacterium]